MRTCVIVLAAASMTACVSARAPSRDGLNSPISTRTGITGEEIAERYHDGNLLDALRGLRGRLLAPQGPDRMRTPAVYLDGVPLLGGLADLAAIRADAVGEVRFLSPIEATTRFGTGHTAGAILVTTVRGRSLMPRERGEAGWSVAPRTAPSSELS